MRNMDPLRQSKCGLRRDGASVHLGVKHAKGGASDLEEATAFCSGAGESPSVAASSPAEGRRSLWPHAGWWGWDTLSSWRGLLALAAVPASPGRFPTRTQTT